MQTSAILTSLVSTSKRQKGAPRPNFAWFTRLLRENRISQRELARRVGVDVGGLNRRLHGQLRLQMDEASRIAQVLHVPIDEILVNAGVALPEHIKPKTKGVPIVGWVDSHFTVHFEKVSGPRFAEAPPVPIAGLVALRIQSAMSKAEAFDGAVAYYRPEEGVPAEAIGKLCVVALTSGESIVRVVRPGYARGQYNLASSSGDPEIESVILKSAAPIVWLKF